MVRRDNGELTSILYVELPTYSLRVMCEKGLPDLVLNAYTYSMPFFSGFRRSLSLRKTFAVYRAGLDHSPCDLASTLGYMTGLRCS